MNFLAHIWLSGNDSQLRIGGFIADAVKGKAFESYPSKIAQGIRLHRRIDAFTDSHYLVKGLFSELKQKFGRHAVILPDLLFDHFLASDFERYTSMSLYRYSIEFNLSLLYYYRYLPLRIKRFLYHFILTNRLYRYKDIDGIRESLEIMVTYRHLSLDTDAIMIHLISHYVEYKMLFDEFFPQLEKYAHDLRNEL